MQWGLPRERTVVLENGQPGVPPARGVSAAKVSGAVEKDLRARFVVLGQLSRLKGTFVALEAVRLLPKSLRRRITVEIHGSMQYEVDDFRERFQQALQDAGEAVRLAWIT